MFHSAFFRLASFTYQWRGQRSIATWLDGVLHRLFLTRAALLLAQRGQGYSVTAHAEQPRSYLVLEPAQIW